MPFAQIVIGIPGAGKSTYCNGAKQFLSMLPEPLKKRNVCLINLDPAAIDERADIDIRALITVEDVMKKFQLGPNGALMYCMDFLWDNKEWLEDEIKDNEDTYYIVDFPGQVELFTDSHTSTTQFVKWFEQHLNMKICIVNLIDVTHCIEPSKYISAVLLCTRMMLCLEYPFISVLSKYDLLSQYSEDLQFQEEFYTKVQDMTKLLDGLNQNRSEKFQRLNKLLVDVVEDFHLVIFQTLAIEDKESLFKVIRAIDRANGLAFDTDGAVEGNEGLFEIAAQEDF